MKISATIGEGGPPIATPSVCWQYVPLKMKNVVRNKKRGKYLPKRRQYKQTGLRQDKTVRSEH